MESAERVGIIEKVMNDGSIGSTFNEDREAISRTEVEANAVVKDTAKADNKPEQQKQVATGKR